MATLDLKNNKLTRTPEDVWGEPNLSALTLRWNSLVELPARFGELEHLETLHLGNNQLSELPVSFAKLKKLKHLNLESNQLSTIPEVVCALPALETLSLSNNAITSIPGAIGQLKRLARLDLNGNQLASLPPELAQLDALELPYDASDFAMLVVLPKRDIAVGEVAAEVDEKGIDTLVEQLHTERVHVLLPRFRIEAALELTATLRSLGIEDAFNPGAADFSGIDGGDELYLSSVIHKVFFDVNEEGTEAAAASAVGVLLSGSGPASKPIEFRADRPFLFFLRDTKTGVVLFSGILDEPLPGKPGDGTEDTAMPGLFTRLRRLIS